MREPCTYCPWRVGVDAWAIGRDHSPEVPPLNRAEMESMARRQGDDFAAPVMACHLTFKGEEEIAPKDRICAGFLLQVGGRNLRTRMMMISKQLDYSAFSCAEPLHEDFEAMLAANPERDDDFAGDGAEG